MARELFRNPAALFFSVIFPLLLMGMFVLITQLTWVRGPYTVAMVGSRSQAAVLEQALGEGSTVRPIEAVPTSIPGGTVAVVVPAAGRHEMRAVVDPKQASAATAIRDALKKTDWRGWRLVASAPDGSGLFDPIVFVLPGAIGFALLSLSLIGTASALVALRSQGTLRLLGTTPARRSAVLLSLLPARVVLAAGAMLLLGVAATAFGLLSPLSMLRMLFTSLLGLAMLLALGYVLGGLLPSPEVANGIFGVLSPLLLMATGLLFPLELLPATAAKVLSYSPLALLGDALRHDVTGGVSRHPLWLSWTTLTTTALVLTALAVRTFRWDTGSAK
jgi:ABC-type polysaccharide/polyol phosphate export permease